MKKCAISLSVCCALLTVSCGNPASSGTSLSQKSTPFSSLESGFSLQSAIFGVFSGDSASRFTQDYANGLGQDPSGDYVIVEGWSTSFPAVSPTDFNIECADPNLAVSCDGTANRVILSPKGKLKHVQVTISTPTNTYLFYVSTTNAPAPKECYLTVNRNCTTKEHDDDYTFYVTKNLSDEWQGPVQWYEKAALLPSFFPEGSSLFGGEIYKISYYGNDISVMHNYPVLAWAYNYRFVETALIGMPSIEKATYQGEGQIRKSDGSVYTSDAFSQVCKDDGSIVPTSSLEAGTELYICLGPNGKVYAIYDYPPQNK